MLRLRAPAEGPPQHLALRPLLRPLEGGETDPEPIILGFGQATSGCFSEVAGQWQGDDLGIATARIPSADQNEIRVADNADNAGKVIIAAWDAAVGEGNGNESFATNDAINLGFDLVEKAA
ncbi:hypothetical protein [Streptomyces sp. TE5632]